MALGLDSYTVTFLDNREQRQTWERFALSLKQAVVDAEDELRRKYGFACLLVSVGLTDAKVSAEADAGSYGVYQHIKARK